MNDHTALRAEREALEIRQDSLKDELLDVDDRRAAIKGQLDKAKAEQWTTGEYADPDWFRRATGAVRHLGVERRDLEREIGVNGRRIRQLNDILSRDLFRLAVMETVDDRTWERITFHHAELEGR